MFFPKETEYGRFIIDKIEAHINPNKIKVIMKPPEPKHSKQLQSFHEDIN